MGVGRALGLGRVGEGAGTLDGSAVGSGVGRGLRLGVTFRIPDSGSACRISRNSGVPAARSGRCERWLLQEFRSRPPAREWDAHVRMRRATRPSAPPMAARDSEERDGAEWPRRHRRWNVQPLLSCLSGEYVQLRLDCHSRAHMRGAWPCSRPRARKLMFRAGSPPQDIGTVTPSAVTCAVRPSLFVFVG